MDVVDELIDRFGEPPASVKGLIDVALLRNTAAQFGFKEIQSKGRIPSVHSRETGYEFGGAAQF